MLTAIAVLIVLTAKDRVLDMISRILRENISTVTDAAVLILYLGDHLEKAREHFVVPILEDAKVSSPQKQVAFATCYGLRNQQILFESVDDRLVWYVCCDLTGGGYIRALE